MKILLGVLGAAGLFAATSSIAGEGYIGVSAGMLVLEGDVVRQINGGVTARSGFSAAVSNYKVFGGYELNEFFALDVAYFRASGTAEPFLFGTPVDISADGFTIRAVGALPLRRCQQECRTSDYFSILGSVGYWDGDTEASKSGFDTTTDSRDGFTWSVGGKYRYESMSIRGEFEWFDSDDKLWTILVGFQVNFGGK
jgi:hypothetical protein